MVHFIVLRRTKPLPYASVLVPVSSIILGIVLSSMMLYLFAGVSPLALFSLITRSFTSPTVLKDTLILTLVGLSLVIVFKASIWNIGAEGQIHMGMLAATWIALFTPLASMPMLAKIICVLIGAVAGALWAALAGVLKAYVGLDEVPVTLMLNYVAYYVLDVLVYGPWRGRFTYGYIRTDQIPESLWLMLIPGTTAHVEVLVVVVIVGLLTWFMFRYTTIGLRLRILGSNPEFLRATGVNVKHVMVLALALSGAIAGVVGALYLLGDAHRLSYPVEAQTAGYGYLGILVAWLSMLDVRAIPLAAYVVSSLRVTGITMQIAGLGSTATVLLFMGSVLLTYTIVKVFSEYTIRVQW